MESNHVDPAVSARCLHRLAHAPRACRARVVSGVLEPPPAGFQPAAPPSELRDQVLGAMGPAAGIEPAASRLRGERPCHSGPRRHGRTSRWCGRRDSNPHPRRGVPGSSPLDDDHMRRSVGALRWTPGRDSHPRDTVCSRAPRSSATGRWLPGRGSNPHLPGNGRTSCRSTTWHGRATDGCCGN